MGEASSTRLIAFLTLGEHLTFELPRYVAQVLGYDFQARSPPMFHLFSMILG
jgi:hypothetical protein